MSGWPSQCIGSNKNTVGELSITLAWIAFLFFYSFIRTLVFMALLHFYFDIVLLRFFDSFIRTLVFIALLLELFPAPMTFSWPTWLVVVDLCSGGIRLVLCLHCNCFAFLFGPFDLCCCLCYRWNIGYVTPNFFQLNIKTKKSRMKVSQKIYFFWEQNHWWPALLRAQCVKSMLFFVHVSVTYIPQGDGVNVSCITTHNNSWRMIHGLCIANKFRRGDV